MVLAYSTLFSRPQQEGTLAPGKGKEGSKISLKKVIYMEDTESNQASNSGDRILEEFRKEIATS